MNFAKRFKITFSIPNMLDTRYGFFEKPEIRVLSALVTKVNLWHVTAEARASYCANFCRDPNLQLDFAFSPFDHTDDDDDNEQPMIMGQILIKIRDNAKTIESEAKQIANKAKVTISNIVMKCQNNQVPIYAFCDEYGSQYYSKLTLNLTFDFDIEKCVAEEEEEEEKSVVEETKEQNRKEDDDGLCVICVTENAVMVNETCNHTVMCQNCAIDFLERSAALLQPYSCPLCRANIGKIYIDTTKIKQCQ